MSRIGEIKARRLFNVILKFGFVVVHGQGSHRLMKHPDGRILLFAFHGSETIGPNLLKKFLKDAGISKDDFQRKR